YTLKAAVFVKDYLFHESIDEPLGYRGFPGLRILGRSRWRDESNYMVNDLLIAGLSFGSLNVDVLLEVGRDLEVAVFIRSRRIESEVFLHRQHDIRFSDVPPFC